VNNGVSQQYTYTAQNQIATITDMTGTTKDAAFAYTYDADGDETQEVEKLGNATSNIPTETINYIYNADGMLYSEVATGSGSFNANIEEWAIYYGYDADGNLLETDGGDFLNGQGDEEQANFWSYNANNELTQYIQYNPDQDNPSNTTTTYTYDANGNEIEADSSTEHEFQQDGDGSVSSQLYTYDVRGEMVKYVDGNGTTTTYTYDDAGNRVKEVHGSTTTTYLNDPENPQGYAQTVEEHVNGAAVPSITYFVGLNGTQGQTAGSTVIYMLRDNRGYARIFTAASGTVTQYDQFDAYGNQTTFNTIPTTHYFPDGVLDAASGLVFHFGGRQSSTVNGDFIEQDGQAYGSNQNPISLNRYVYGADSPINMTDPSGHDPLGEELFVTGVQSLLFALNVYGLVTNTYDAVKAGSLAVKAYNRGDILVSLAYAASAVFHLGLAGLSAAGLNSGLTPPPSTSGSIIAFAGGSDAAAGQWLETLAIRNPALIAWVLSELEPALASALGGTLGLVAYSTSNDGNGGGTSSGGGSSSGGGAGETSFDVTSSDVGAGPKTYFLGKLTVVGSRAKVYVDLLVADKDANIPAIVNALKRIASSHGATSLEIEADVVNPRLRQVLIKRYNPQNLGGDHYSITVGLP
jgi:RHS repeat-associated protein